MSFYVYFDDSHIHSGNNDDFVNKYGEWEITLSNDSLIWDDALRSCERSGQRLAIFDKPEKILGASRMLVCGLIYILLKDPVLV